jgi:predicted alpha/beta-hydrolase family hydrolase
MSRSSDAPDGFDVPTPLGPARVHRRRPSSGESAAGTLVLGHGAGGGVQARDLQAVAASGAAAGWQVLLVEQPWRVAGRRVAPAPARLDEAWLAVMDVLAAAPAPDGGASPVLRGQVVLGGRSAGARVACRTARDVGARGVCCLAFPLHPPGRPDRSRADELAGAGVPVLVVQGERDPFGGPAEVAGLGLPGVEVVGVPGDHGLSASAGAAADAVITWLARLASLR